MADQDTGWNIGNDFTLMNAGKLALAGILGYKAVEAQAETAKVQNDTQNQTMKIITVAVIILITMYAIKRA